ncbi:MAG: hypothetical protein EBT13_18450, partial [Rhodobacteraceae bacterium]|nr:hypothetical protein [Paracoccaceae bacterium]
TTGRPNALLWETANMDTTAAAEKSEVVPRDFVGGVTYWIGLRSSAAITVQALALTACTPINGRTAFPTTAAATLVQTLAYATATPSTWTWNAADISTNTPPIIAWKV